MQRNRFDLVVFISRVTVLLAATALSCASEPRTAQLDDVPRERQDALLSAAPQMPTARFDRYSTTKLASGEVLVVGGYLMAGGATAAVDLYNPATNTWTSRAPLPVASAMHSATLLSDGSVLIFGGNNFGTAINTPYRYSPSSNTWQAVIGGLAMPSYVYSHSAGRLADGRVLILYEPGTSTMTTQAVVFSLPGTWVAVTPPPFTCTGCAMLSLADGRMLVTGGTLSSAPSRAAAVFDPTTSSWTTLPQMVGGHRFHSMALISAGARAGKIAIGGGDSNPEAVDFFDPATQTFSSLSTVGEHDYGPLVVLANGSIMIAGDSQSTGVTNSGIDFLSANGAAFVVTESMPYPRETRASIPLSDGRVLLLGGIPGWAPASASNVLWAPPVSCAPQTCAAAGAACGTIADGCGGTVSCGTCGTGTSCVNNFCVASCVPLTCASWGANVCGSLSNGCGGVLSCGSCAAGASCISNSCVSAPLAAQYDATLKVKRCAQTTSSCSATVTGRASVGPEANAPNTLYSACADGTAGSFHFDESIDAIRVLNSSSAPLAAGSTVTVEVDVWAYAAFSSDKLDLFWSSSIATPSWALAATLTPTKAGANTLRASLQVPQATGDVALRAQFRYGGAAIACQAGSWNDHDDLVFAVAPRP